MSSKARRVRMAEVHRFPWRPRAGGAAAPAAAAAAALAPLDGPIADAEAPGHRAEQADAAYARGYEQGSRAATEAARARAELAATRLGESIDELASLRRRIVTQVERDLVELALAIAGRIVRREVAIDRELVVAIARVALERLGERTDVTIHLNPEDHAFAVNRHGERWAGSGVTAVPDPQIQQGGCRVESPFGTVDASIEAQLAELAHGMLPDDGGQQGG